MQSLHSGHPSPLAARRTHFIRDIQNMKRDDIKRRARSQLLYSLDREQLQDLIQLSQHSLNPQRLASLVRYANQHFPRAIAHLGNLLIQGTLRVNDLQKFQLEPGFHPYWLWLIEVMVELQYCTEPLLDHCMGVISPKRSQKTVQNALSILYKITRSQLCSPGVLLQTANFKSILSVCLRSDTAVDMGYLLLNQLIVQSRQDQIGRVAEGGRERLVGVLVAGSMSIKPKIKYLTCSIIYQLLLKGHHLAQLDETLLVLIKVAAQVHLQGIILDILLELVIRADMGALLKMIDLGFLIQLGEWKRQLWKTEDDQNHSKLIQAAREIQNRMSNLPVARGIQHQLKKYCLLTFTN